MQLAADELFSVLSTTPVCNCTTYIIATQLRRNNERGARWEYEHDGDKVSNSPFQSVLEQHLGCRTHGVKDCESWICKKSPHD